MTNVAKREGETKRGKRCLLSQANFSQVCLIVFVSAIAKKSMQTFCLVGH